MLGSLLALLTPETLIKSFGYAGVFFIVFAESGLFFGFFLPGDSLLMTAGLFAARGELNLPFLIVLCALGAILGDTVGYLFGRKTGEELFKKEESRLFKKSHLVKAQNFYDKHGGKTIVLARFMPFIRTFAPIVAGAARMHYPQFVAFNAIGGIGWGMGMPLVGYLLGKTLENTLTPAQVDKYFLLIVLGVVVLSLLPPVVHTLRDADSRAYLRKSLANFVYALPGLHPNRQP